MAVNSAFNIACFAQANYGAEYHGAKKVTYENIHLQISCLETAG